MFMDPSNMDATARKYWELTHAKILQRSFGDGDGVAEEEVVVMVVGVWPRRRRW
jgi:hypothetical protein